MKNFIASIMQEKRRYSRYNLPLELFVNSREKENEENEEQINISEEGLCFESGGNFEQNDFVFFHLQGKKKTELEHVKFSVLGKIVWCKKNGNSKKKYGAQFKFYNDPFSNQQRVNMLSALNTSGQCA